MKRYTGLFLFLGLALFSVVPIFVYAHYALPILMIDGKFVLPPLNPHTTDGQEVPSTAPNTYAPEQKILFVINEERFGIPIAIDKKMTFVWDFGDGTSSIAEVYALKKSHTFSKPGLYTVQVMADYRTAGYAGIAPQLIAIANVVVGEQVEATPTPIQIAPVIPSQEYSVWNTIDFWTIAKYSLLIGLVLTILFSFSIQRMSR